MSVESADGSGIGTIIRAGFEFARWANRNTGWNAEERAAASAARSAGYVHTRRGWRTPDGRLTLERDVLAAGRELSQAAPPVSRADTIGNAPAPAVPVVFVPGRDTTAARRRRGGGPGYRPSWWRTNPGWQAYKDCIRRGYDPIECEELTRGPLPPVMIPPKAPPRVPVPSADVVSRAAVIARVLVRVGGPLIGVLWPSRTADDDTIPGPMPQPQRAPTRGPTRRPRVKVADPPRLPDIWRYPQPRFPGDFEQPAPGQRPDILTQPAPGPRPLPAPAPQPRTLPRPLPRPKPTPAPRAPSVPSWWTYVVPTLPSLLPRRPEREPLTPIQRAPLRYTAPQPFALPLQARPANCPPCEKERKRKRNKCTNPVTGRRTFTRNGTKFRTITRKLEC